MHMNVAIQFHLCHSFDLSYMSSQRFLRLTSPQIKFWLPMSMSFPTSPERRNYKHVLLVRHADCLELVRYWRRCLAFNPNVVEYNGRSTAHPGV